MVPNPTRFRHILLILLLLMLMAALPLSASAATTGTITASANYVTEGGILQLSTNMSGTVTWTSSSPSTATVSSGQVTGVKAGQVTITASCSGYTDASITLWVTVPEGVYYLKNASSGLCMETVVDTAYVYTQNTNATARVSQLWKISYVSNGNYIIRPLGDFSLAMTVGDSGYVTVEKDSSASAGIYWQISHNAFGYAFKHGGSNSKTAMPTVNGPTGVPVYPSSWTSSLTCHWELEEICGVFLRDTSTQKILSSSTLKTIELGRSASLNSLGITYDYSGYYVGMTWSSSDNQVATVDAASGAVTTVSRGQAVITLNMNLQGSMYAAKYLIVVQETINIINLYDSTLSNSDILSNVDDAVAFLNTIYYPDYYIYFTTFYAPLAYSGTIDQCPNVANAPCSLNICGTDCSNHHKNLYRIAYELYNTQWTPNNVVVMWSNSPLNTFCEMYNVVHVTSSAFGVTVLVNNVPLPTVQILSVNNFSLSGDYGESSDKAYMAVILAHEIAHTLGLKEIYLDAYGDGADHAGQDGMQCIMEYAHGDSMDSLFNQGYNALCDYCREKLQEEISSNVYEN